MFKRFLRDFLGKKLIGFLIELYISLKRYPTTNKAKKNVLILGMGRSGTTWISNDITEKFRLKDFGEIFQFPVKNPIRYLNNLLHSNENNKIFKVLIYQLEENALKINEFISWINSNIDFVLIVRRNSFDRILSVLYSEKTNLWHQKGAQNQAMKVTIDKSDFIKMYEENLKQVEKIEHIQQSIKTKKMKLNFEDYQKAKINLFDELGKKITKTNKRNEKIKPKKKAVKLGESGASQRIKNLKELKNLYNALNEKNNL